MQVGSDGRTACASCHFHAGADHRAQNQLVDPSNAFPANHSLATVDFPFRLLADPSNRNSEALRDTSVRAGSAGLFRRIFRDIVPGQAAEIGEEATDKPEFMIGGLQVRRVTVRNSPSVVNAVFNVRNFWDGRASRVFNGFNPSGDGAAAPGALWLRDGVLVREAVRLDNASLASQATGPALDNLEMSYQGRTWPKLGKKLFSLAPLALQRVAADDGVLGSMARVDARGLSGQVTYLGLVRGAFVPELWDSTQLVDESGASLAGRFGASESTSEFTQAEYNFSVFWGLALQAYQATLISAESPLDRFLEGDTAALNAQEQEGMRLFQTTGRCTTCHGGAELTAASFSNQGGRGNRAFQRTGVRPAAEDLGQQNGNFKSSGLRNIEFSGPYFHNGGQASLEQVVDFYARGGDFQNNAIRAFNVSGAQKASLVAFMKSLTDDRVRFERAPFDHPELCVSAGHVMAPSGSATYPRESSERWVEIAVSGAAGLRAPLQSFDELLAGRGSDGSRSHTLDKACSIPLP